MKVVCSLFIALMDAYYPVKLETVLYIHDRVIIIVNGLEIAPFGFPHDDDDDYSLLCYGVAMHCDRDR